MIPVEFILLALAPVFLAFIIWEWWRTERDDEPCRYGITEDFTSDNPVTITFYEWRRMLQDALTARSLRQLLGSLFGAPKRAGND